MVSDNVFKEHMQCDSKQNRTPRGDTKVRTESVKGVSNSERGRRG